MKIHGGAARLPKRNGIGRQSIAAYTQRYNVTGMQRHGASRSRFFFWGSQSLDSQRPRLKGAGDVLRQRHPRSGWPWRCGLGGAFLRGPNGGSLSGDP